MPSQDSNTLISKLNNIQLNMRAPKSHTNEFGKYQYRTAEDILQAVKPHLDGCVLLVSDTIKCIEGRHYVEATVTFTDGDNKIKAHGWAREDLAKKGMSDSQVTGATSSYARKYALSAMFAISGETDADADNNWDKEIAEYKRMVDLAKEDSDANALDLYMFKMECEVEEWKSIFYGYMEEYALKGGKTKLKTTLKELNDVGMNQAIAYREVFMSDDETAIQECKDELTEYQSAFIQTLVDGQ